MFDSFKNLFAKAKLKLRFGYVYVQSLDDIGLGLEAGLLKRYILLITNSFLFRHFNFRSTRLSRLRVISQDLVVLLDVIIGLR